MSTQVKKQHRMLKISILRYNPADPASVPHMQTFECEEADSMTLFILLNELRDHQDPTLQFDFVCRAGICGSCSTVAWNAVAVSPVAVRYACARTSPAALPSTRSLASASIRVTPVMTVTSMMSSVTIPACSVACRCSHATTSARRICP